MIPSSIPLNSSLLYVEDEVIVALDVYDGLKDDLGFDVEMAHNLKSAMEKCETRSFDYALLDMNLGNGENSLELGMRLARRGTHVVFASGYNRNEIAQIDQFQLIEKPFQLADIAAAFAATAPAA
ncbi:Response regulator receiver domain-containing protein [Loktanella fryxellensis]|uniref:Response regulator receiver domain-containing protein n=1 Tax=Loktanella fryxellensis TaxID=245187 RepID=A0A1H8CMU0_9RHOB|nr:response regulator [Loktanella fryxellensis]SEM95734.1 Response regulator receiver domain-containing protein [Loktanella fryxellensis]